MAVRAGRLGAVRRTFLWLATISIVTQVFYNLEVMRYTLYCGEPIFAGFFRLAPGPKFWTVVYLVLCVSHIWPFMASNAAVPLAAALLGHLPGNNLIHVAGFVLSESRLVKLLGYVLFLLAFVPLIFGGKIYNVLERMMTAKLVIVLGFLVSDLDLPHRAAKRMGGLHRLLPLRPGCAAG